MSFTTLVLVGVGLLVVAAMITLAAIVVGIRRGDRGHLANQPDTASSAFARRILVGVRYPSENGEGEGQ